MKVPNTPNSVEIEGMLESLEHVWSNGELQYSDLHIIKGSSCGTHPFRGYVPESIVGRKVHLYQSENKNSLFQRLTSTEGDLTYQIRATSNFNKRKPLPWFR